MYVLAGTSRISKIASISIKALNGNEATPTVERV
jgi:hypothetical protein